MKKYELLIDNFIIHQTGIKLYRIRALRDFGRVRAGNIGGYVQGEHNLSHDGNCWIGGYTNEDEEDGPLRIKYYNGVHNTGILAIVMGDAVVSDSAQVCDRAYVRGRAQVCGRAIVCGAASISEEARIMDNAIIRDNATVCGRATIQGNSMVMDDAWVWGEACITDTTVCHYAEISKTPLTKQTIFVGEEEDDDDGYDGDIEFDENGEPFDLNDWYDEMDEINKENSGLY